MKAIILLGVLAVLLPLVAGAQAPPRTFNRPPPTLGRPAPPRAVARPTLSPAAREAIQQAEQGCQSDGFEADVCERAIARLEEAARAAPEQVEVRLALAQAYWNRGFTERPGSRARANWQQRSKNLLQGMVDQKVEDARPYYELSIREKEDAQRVPLLRQSVELDPRHPRAHQDLAWGLVRQGRLDEASRVYQEHLEVSPVKDRQEASEHLRFAEHMARVQRPRQAAQVLGTVMEQTRNERSTERCLLFQSVDAQVTAALPQLRGELQKLRPYCTDKEHLDRAVELEQQGRVDEAIAELEQQVATNPKPEETHVMLERLHERKGELGKAAEAAEKALRAEPEVKERCERFQRVSPRTLRGMPPALVEAMQRECEAQ